MSGLLGVARGLGLQEQGAPSLLFQVGSGEAGRALEEVTVGGQLGIWVLVPIVEEGLGREAGSDREEASRAGGAMGARVDGQEDGVGVQRGVGPDARRSSRRPLATDTAVPGDWGRTPRQSELTRGQVGEWDSAARSSGRFGRRAGWGRWEADGLQPGGPEPSQGLAHVCPHGGLSALTVPPPRPGQIPPPHTSSPKPGQTRVLEDKTGPGQQSSG